MFNRLCFAQDDLTVTSLIQEISVNDCNERSRWRHTSFGDSVNRITVIHTKSRPYREKRKEHTQRKKSSINQRSPFLHCSQRQLRKSRVIARDNTTCWMLQSPRVCLRTCQSGRLGLDWEGPDTGSEGLGGQTNYLPLAADLGSTCHELISLSPTRPVDNALPPPTSPLALCIDHRGRRTLT